jgi:hypothetical protein
MKFNLLLLAAGLLVFVGADAQAQGRNLGARQLKLDDGAGGILTISYTGPGNSNLVIPSGGISTIPAGGIADQTLRWSGAAWTASSGLMNDGANVSIPAGALTVISNGGSSSSFTSTGAMPALRAEIMNNASVSGAFGSITNGLGIAGTFFNTNPANNFEALSANTAGNGAAVAGVSASGPGVMGTGNGGVGVYGVSTGASGGYFTSTNGPGVAGSSAGSVGVLGTSGGVGKYAGQFIGGVDAYGVEITSGTGGVGLRIVQGRFIGSTTVMGSGGTVPLGYMIVEVDDDGAGGVPAVATMPALAENGTIIIITTNDPDGVDVNGVNQTRAESRTWVKTNDVGFGGDGWKVNL